MAENKKLVIIMFGGIAPEHEVSVISGLQIVEKIDRVKYDARVIFVTKKGEFEYLGAMTSRKEFLTKKREAVTFGRDKNGGYIQMTGIFGQKLYPYAAFLAFHGGIGENGSIQGMLETFSIPFTSPSSEGAVISMNKQLTKEVMNAIGIATVPGISVFSSDIKGKDQFFAKKISKELSLPVIVKPAHLGSSIGITVARTEIDLQKALLSAAHMDSEIVVEKYMTKYIEYNCAVRKVNGVIETSEVERPITKDEILSFADKYQRSGGKKTGGRGMASLERELPAKISNTLRDSLQEKARRVFAAIRGKGMVRIDFMATEQGDLYLTEVNPIPGSLAFYLWEASGITFKQQITDMLEQAVLDEQERSSYELDYSTDIVEKFVKAGT